MDTVGSEFTEYERRVIEALRAVREAAGVDQIPLGLAAGMSRNQVGRFERFERHASLGNLERLVGAIAATAPRRTNITTVFDLLLFAEGKIPLTIEQSRHDV